MKKTKTHDITVNVMMPVYNHEKYLQQSLNSILNQNFNGIIKVVVGEDCSTDGSRDIIRSYQEKYPDYIDAIYQEENVGMYKNERDISKRLKGDYIAILEGDDYWCDQYKLQKQVDFLETHPEYYGVTHNVKVVDEDGLDIGNIIYPFREEGDYTLEDFLAGIQPGQTASFVLRNCFANKTEEDIDRICNYRMNGDTRFLLTMLLEGKVYVMETVMSVYRYITTYGDSWNARAITQNLSDYYFNSALEMERFAYDEYGVTINAQSKRYNALLNSVLHVIRNRRKEDLCKFFYIWKREPEKKTFIIFFVKKLTGKVSRK